MERFSERSRTLIPGGYFNIKPLLPSLPPPPRHPALDRILSAEDLSPVFPRGFIDHETSMDPVVPVPGEVQEALSIWRPTPLIRAVGLERLLGTGCTILYKYEGVSPTGSHKSNTAVMQAFLASREGVEELVTETGAGQWGSALSHACRMFGLRTTVFMVRASYRQKPGRRSMIQLFGADVVESPSGRTACGRAMLEGSPDHPGSLGIAISEAVEAVLEGGGRRYSLGSVLDSVLLHQSVIGLEALDQLRSAGAFPDVVIGCVGGGSNFAGLAFPILGEVLREGAGCRFVAVESESCASLTRGDLRYDNGDCAGLTPLLFMHTLGRDFIPPPIHAGGLRYHGMAPLVSHCVSLGLVEPLALGQEEAFAAARAFLQVEGILPAPESAHAVAAVIREAVAADGEGVSRTILFNLSGHGHFDIAAFAG